MTQVMESENLEYQDTVTVDRKVQDCFTYLADLRNMKGWNKAVSHVKKTSQGPIDRNIDFHVHYQLGLIPFDLVFEISEYAPSEKITTIGRCDAFSVTYTFEFHPKGEQQTEIKMSSAVSSKGAFSLMRPLSKYYLRNSVEESMKDLKLTLTESPCFQPLSAREQWEGKFVLPRLFNLTRFGYLRKKNQWQPYFNRMEGKQVLVTDGTSDLGRELVETFCRLGARVFFVSSNQKAAESLLAEMSASGYTDISFETLDLSLMSDVLALVDKTRTRFDKLSVLVNNYGEIITKRQTTKEGLEKSFASLLLGPFLLTESLYDLLEKASSARVINLVSSIVLTQPIDVEDLEGRKKPYNGFMAYARARRGILDVSHLWAQKWGDHAKIRVHCVNPGLVASYEAKKHVGRLFSITKNLMRDTEQAADSVIWLATSPETLEMNGVYWLDRRPFSESILKSTHTEKSDRETLYEALRQYYQQQAEQQTGT